MTAPMCYTSSSVVATPESNGYNYVTASWVPYHVNPFGAPEPLPILNPSNFVPKNGFPVVKGLTLGDAIDNSPCAEIGFSTPHNII